MRVAPRGLAAPERGSPLSPVVARADRWRRGGACRLPFLAAAALALLACGQEAGELQGLCDPRLRACQKGVYRELVELRGGLVVPSLPRVRLIGRAALEQLARAGEGEGAGTAREPSCVAQAFSHGLQQLGLLAPATPVGEAAAATFAEGVAAFYSSADDTITIIDEPSAEPALDLGTLAHELTHALQQREGLAERLDGWRIDGEPIAGTDAATARLALSEGEATFLGLAVAVTRGGRSWREANWEAAFAQLETLVGDDVRAAASPYVVAQFELPYALGGRYFSRRFFEQERVDLEAIYEAWPRSTIGLVAALDDAAPAERVPLACGRLPAPAESRVVDDDRLGLVAAYALGASALELTDPWSLAREWRDDRMLQHAASGAIFATSWRLRLARSASAQALYEQASARAAARGWQVLRLADEELALLGAWPEPATRACVANDEPAVFGPVEAFEAETVCRALERATSPANTSLGGVAPARPRLPHLPPPSRRLFAAALR
ncbi:MAG: hypothetical protein IPL40_03450 [Proteobacteria bacterium]|nr:hypothetical protein [Pseudomonadota bacterium]